MVGQISELTLRIEHDRRDTVDLSYHGMNYATHTLKQIDCRFGVRMNGEFDGLAGSKHLTKGDDHRESRLGAQRGELEGYDNPSRHCMLESTAHGLHDSTTRWICTPVLASRLVVAANSG